MNTLSQEMLSLRSVPDDKNIKIKAGLIRDEISTKATYAAVAMAAASVLAWIADNTPISFEERKNIDTILESLQNVPVKSRTEESKLINDLMLITKHYIK